MWGNELSAHSGESKDSWRGGGPYVKPPRAKVLALSFTQPPFGLLPPSYLPRFIHSDCRSEDSRHQNLLASLCKECEQFRVPANSQRSIKFITNMNIKITIFY